MKVYASKDSENFVGMVPSRLVPEFVKEMKEEGNYWGSYLSDKGKVVAVDKWGDEHITSIEMNESGDIIE